VPGFVGEHKAEVTIRQLLTHTGGIRAGASDIRDVPASQVRGYLLRAPLALTPGQDVLYSDIGFVILYLAAERAAGEPLPRYLQHRVWGPLGMRATSMGLPVGCTFCAPTLYLAEEDAPYAGGSYDEIGRRLEGLSGNAGALRFSFSEMSAGVLMVRAFAELCNRNVFRIPIAATVSSEFTKRPDTRPRFLLIK
jgi:CubicO group peptidase (beta-lactamase class C family)